MQLLDAAIAFAARAHAPKYRKGTTIPYISHPYAVGLLLAQIGCDPEVIAAGILHDTLEDAGVQADELVQRFGARVAAIVVGCSEPDKDGPWEQRKEHTIAYLRDAPSDIRLVACADKLHNARAMASDLALEGEPFWTRFRRGVDQQAWYYRGVTESLRPRAEETQLARLHPDLAQEVAALFER